VGAFSSFFFLFFFLGGWTPFQKQISINMFYY
jgi:hypothetical protein